MFCRSFILCLLNCVTGTIQMTEGRKYSLRVPYVVHPYPLGWRSKKERKTLGCGERNCIYFTEKRESNGCQDFRQCALFLQKVGSWLGRSSISESGTRLFSLLQSVQSLLGPTQDSNERLPVFFSTWLRRAGCKADPLFPFTLLHVKRDISRFLTSPS